MHSVFSRKWCCCPDGNYTHQLARLAPLTVRIAHVRFCPVCAPDAQVGNYLLEALTIRVR